MATFITSKSVGESIYIYVETSTGYWKYNHNGSNSGVFNQIDGSQTIEVLNANGEFTLIPCDASGTVSGDITILDLNTNQLTSFDGTGLSSLTNLFLNDNLLTSFDSTGLSGLTNLYLYNNQLTSFNGVGLSGLTTFDVSSNQLTSFDGTGLSGLTSLNLASNPLTSFIGGDMGQITNLPFRTLWGITTLTSLDVVGMWGLENLSSYGNPLTPEDNDPILAQLASNGLTNGTFTTSGGRTAAGTDDYDTLIGLGWTISGADLPLPVPVTFVTSRINDYIYPNIETTTGFWKGQHGGVTTSIINSGDSDAIQITNSNGEVRVVSCDVDGNISGDIIAINIGEQQITSFNGTGLSGLTNLYLFNNQLTSFDPTELSSLIYLNLGGNQLTSFDGVGLSGITYLDLSNSLQLTSFNGTGLSSLTEFYLNNSPITSFIGGDMGIDGLDFPTWGITTLESFDGGNMSGLTFLNISYNQLTSFNGTGLTSLTYLDLNGNLTITPQINDSILAQLVSNGLEGGQFYSANGRTAAGTTDYDTLINRGWTIGGLGIPSTVTFTTSKSVGEFIYVEPQTSAERFICYHDGNYSGPFAGGVSIEITNPNGEFTITATDNSGNIDGYFTYLNLYDNQITSFSGAGLSNLTYLDLANNLLTSFDDTGLSSLQSLYLNENLLTTFDGTGLSSLTLLNLTGNDKAGKNLLSSLNLTGLSNLITLYVNGNQLTSFDGTGLTSLDDLVLRDNQLTSVNLSDCSKLRSLYINNNSSINNPTTNNSILAKLAANELLNGWGPTIGGSFVTAGGRTSASTTDYNYLISNNWGIQGADLPPMRMAIRVKGATQI